MIYNIKLRLRYIPYRSFLRTNFHVPGETTKKHSLQNNLVLCVNLSMFYYFHLHWACCFNVLPTPLRHRYYSAKDFVQNLRFSQMPIQYIVVLETDKRFDICVLCIVCRKSVNKIIEKAYNIR